MIPAVEYSATPRARRIRKVLMTCDAVGGVWRYSLDLARALRLRGVESTLAVMGPPPSSAQLREAAGTGAALVDRPYRLEWMDEPWDDVACAGRWLQTLADAIEPDIVHLNGYSHAALNWSAPVVVVAHSCVRTWWRAVKGECAPARFDRYAGAVRAGLQAAAAVAAPTHAMLREIEHEYSCRVPGKVIPNGCWKAGKRSGHRSREAVVFAAGRVWDEGKNLRLLCEASAGLRWRVCVAGDACRPDGDATTLPGVRVLGALSSVAMEEWYRRAAIYSLPAKYEPFGLSVLEAASNGCALVLGDIESLRENWSGAAEFVSPADASALRNALQALIDAPGPRSALARAAAARAAEFTMDRTADEYLRLYEDLL